jgi:hypothetical protein
MKRMEREWMDGLSKFAAGLTAAAPGTLPNGAFDAYSRVGAMRDSKHNAMVTSGQSTKCRGKHYKIRNIDWF